MKGNDKVVELLNHMLADELTEVSQYMVHSSMCDNWGYRNPIKPSRSVQSMK